MQIAEMMEITAPTTATVMKIVLGKSPQASWKFVAEMKQETKIPDKWKSKLTKEDGEFSQDEPPGGIHLASSRNHENHPYTRDISEPWALEEG